jgi:NAD(P)-dependent dehydrogenase (short-subunit alcohol dehydrogenase family)
MTRLAGSVVVVTGGASGIGRELALRCAAEGARVAVVDLDAGGAEAVAASLPGALGLGLDVTDEQAVRSAARRIEDELGPVDVWCSNAGIAGGPGLGDDAAWDATYRVHVLAHVYVARHVVPGMVARGRGHVMLTASAAGLLTEMDAAPYAVTKHGTVALAEWLAIQHAGSGVTFSCLCPQGVQTPMTAGLATDAAVRAAGRFLSTAEVADAVLAAWDTAFLSGSAEPGIHGFLILPHLEVAEYERRRASDRDRWLSAMARVRTQLPAAAD